MFESWRARHSFMKILGRIITVLFSLSIILILGMTIYFNVYGKSHAQKVLSTAFKQPVNFDRIIFRLPFSFHLVNFSVEPYVSATRVDIYPYFNSFFTKDTSINTLVFQDAIINIKRVKPFEKKSDEVDDETSYETNEEQVEVESKNKDIKEGSTTETLDTKKKVVIQNLKVKNSTVHYADTTKTNPLVFTLNKFELDMQSITLPNLNENVFFNVSSVLQAGRKELDGGSARADGWINWGKRDMQANIKVLDPKQKDALNASLVANNNVLDVNGEILIKNFGIDVQSKEGKTKSIQNLVSDMLSTVGIDIGAKFKFQTQMDDFKITDVSFTGSIVSD
jgi:hypothetical protein